MRKDILIVDEDGEGDSVARVSIRKAIGEGYDQGWFTNTKGIRYRLFKGARSTKKSYNIMGYEPLCKIMSDENVNIVMIRQNESDHRQTTFSRLMSCVYDLGLEDVFVPHLQPLYIEYKLTGQQIIFRGMNNPTGLNGLEFIHGDLTDIYVEEAFEISSYDDFRKLDGSLRGRRDLQITMCFNAWSQETWLYTEFFKGRLEDDYEAMEGNDAGYMEYLDRDFIGDYGRGLYLHWSAYRINEFRDIEVYDAAAAKMKEKALEIYKVEFLGMWGNATATVYPYFNNSLVLTTQEILSRFGFIDFAIGIDTGYSAGDGTKIKVKAGEKPEERVRSATTAMLCGITEGFDNIVVIDEYFHSNDKKNASLNTDGDDRNLGIVELAEEIVRRIAGWMQFYGDDAAKSERYVQVGVDARGEPVRKKINSSLMRGTINIYVDSADLGFRQVLEATFNRFGIYNVSISASTKLSIQSRVDFTNLMQAYGNYFIADKCKNIIREFKNARRGDKGEARADGDDHCLTAYEYSTSPMLNSLRQWKNFKEH